MAKAKKKSNPVIDDLRDECARLDQIADYLEKEGFLIAALHVRQAIEHVDDRIADM